MGEFRLKKCHFSWKLLVSLFIIFICITSKTFKRGVLESLGDSAVGKPWGKIIQGVLLVLCYILALYLIDSGIL